MVFKACNANIVRAFRSIPGNYQQKTFLILHETKLLWSVAEQMGDDKFCPDRNKSKSSKQREEKKRATHYHRDENSSESAVRRRKKCQKIRNRTFRCIEIEFQLSIHCNKFGSWKSTTIIHLNIVHNSSLRELMHDACSSCFLQPARTQTFGSLSICAFVI